MKNPTLILVGAALLFTSACSSVHRNTATANTAQVSDSKGSATLEPVAQGPAARQPWGQRFSRY